MTNTNEQRTIRTSVYRYYDDQDILLYIGVSKHPIRRLAEHRRDKFWHLQIHRIEINWYSSKRVAHDVEGVAIALENPLYNATGAHKDTIRNYLDGLLFADVMMDIRNNCDPDSKEIYLSVDDLVFFNSATFSEVKTIVTWLSKAGIVRLRKSRKRSYWVLADDTRCLAKLTARSWFIDDTGPPRPAVSSQNSRMNSIPFDASLPLQRLPRLHFSRKREVRTYAN